MHSSFSTPSLQFDSTAVTDMHSQIFLGDFNIVINGKISMKIQWNEHNLSQLMETRRAHILIIFFAFFFSVLMRTS